MTKFTKSEIIYVLTEYNKWRRSEGIYGEMRPPRPYPPNIIGQVIDGAIGLLESVWQPIETAPEDDREIIISTGCHIRGWVIASRHEDKDWYYDENGESYVDVSRWMPLPTPLEGGNDDGN